MWNPVSDRGTRRNIVSGLRYRLERGIHLGSEQEQRKAEAIAEIGNDGVVIVRPDGTIETIELQTRKKPPAPKGTNRKPLLMRASDELVAGYRATAQMAEQRRTQSLEEGRDREAAAWAKIVRYCTYMADKRLVDASDQRSSYVMPMDAEQMDVLGVRVLWSQSDSPLDEWQRLALESALSTLSEMERVCYESRFGALLDEREIAIAESITRRQVRTHLRRASGKLRKIKENTRSRGTKL